MCGTGVLLPGFLSHMINDGRVQLTFMEQGASKHRVRTLDPHDVEKVCWGAILWNKRNIDQQYREADYAVFLAYESMEGHTRSPEQPWAPFGIAVATTDGTPCCRRDGAVSRQRTGGP